MSDRLNNIGTYVGVLFWVNFSVHGNLHWVNVVANIGNWISMQLSFKNGQPLSRLLTAKTIFKYVS